MTTIDAGTGSAYEATNTVTGSPQIEVRSPADGPTIGTVAACSASDVAATVARLRAAQPDWEALGPVLVNPQLTCDAWG
jgi:acyl-CoA reductase-like NAD-dependent aldehyde dehydrogenase